MIVRLNSQVLRITSIAVACALAAAACEPSRSIPRIDPRLHNWFAEAPTVAGVRVHAFNTGSLYLPAAAVYRGGSWLERRRLDVPAFVVEHPRVGLVAFDTGLAPEAREDPIAELGFVSWLTGMVDMKPRAELAVQMQAAGLDPARVSYVVVSHLHFDHAGALDAFPNATAVTARGEKDAALARGGLLVDPYGRRDWSGAKRWTEIDFSAGAPLATFTSHHDLLADGSILLVDLRGHTPGSLGMIVRAPNGPVLLTGDAAWVDESWVYAGAPISAHDLDGWWEQIWRIKKMAQLVPGLLVIAGHDLSRAERAKRTDVLVHELGAPAQVAVR